MSVMFTILALYAPLGCMLAYIESPISNMFTFRGPLLEIVLFCISSGVVTRFGIISNDDASCILDWAVAS